jgi:hypothetical protein
MSRRKRKTAITVRSRRRPSSPPAAAALPLESVHYDGMTLGLGTFVVAAAGLLFGATAARDIVVGDTPEFITAAITLGVPHGPGYPLFTILGHVFSLLPVGPLPFRVNLLAAVCGAITVGIVYFTALHLTRHRLPSAGAALVLASSPLFWRWSLVAEVFSLNNLLASVFVFLLVLWQERPERTNFLVAAALVSGLALTNQQTFVLFGPAVIFLLWQQRTLLLARPRLIAACVVALLIGLLPYLYVPWAAARYPVVNWQGVASLADFFALVLRRHCGTGQLICMGPYQGGSAIERILAFGASFGLLAGLLVILGMIQAYQQRRYFWFVLLALLFAGPAFVAYANINLSLGPTLFVLERFFLLSHVIVAPLIAFGLLFIATRLAGFLPTIRAHTILFVTAGALLIALTGVRTNYDELDQSKNHVARRIAEDILSTTKPGTLLLVAGDEVVLPLLYLQAAEGQRPEVTLVLVPMLPGDWYVRQLRQRYPDLVIPFNHYDGRSGTMKTLIDANQGRPIAVVGELLDKSTEGSYWFYRYGLIHLLEPMTKDVMLPQMISDNEDLLSRYRPPSPDNIKSKTFERNILTHYATTAMAVGLQCETLRQFSEARKWFQRALAIDPAFSAAQQALSRITKAQ